jgi:hypothetical protein
LDAALAVATGKPWLNRFDCSPGRALLVFEEEDPGSVLERLDLLYAGYSLSQEAGDALPVEFLIAQGVQIVDAEGNLDTVFESQVRDFQPDLLIIDPLRRVHNLDENDSAQMSRLFNAFRQLTTIPPNLCSILLVHHLRKRNEFDGDLDRLRGSSDIAASVDSILEVSGEFRVLRVKHLKAKRGPAQKTFMVQADVSETSVKLAHFDPEEKAGENRAEVRAFVLGLLNAGEVKQIDLWMQGKARGFGKERLKNVCEALLAEGLIEAKPGPRGSKIFHVAAGGAGVVAATSGGGQP